VALGGRPPGRERVRAELERVRAAWLAEWTPMLGSAEVPISPYRVIGEFMRTVDPRDAIVTHDSGSPRDQLLPFYRAVLPRSYLGWGKSHALGTGLGLIIGAKLAAPDKFCVNFMGDAAFGMTGLDFETAVRCGIPILTVVLNNSAMAIEIPHLAGGAAGVRHQPGDALLPSRRAAVGRRYLSPPRWGIHGTFMA
jgi:thiamine pyrophosphate-dependent acetolactate synthase large subunit-like protein